MGVTIFVAGICKTPIRTTASLSDRIKPMAPRILTEIIVKLEKPSQPFGSDACQETSVLEIVHVNKAIRIHFTEGNIHMDE